MGVRVSLGWGGSQSWSICPQAGRPLPPSSAVDKDTCVPGDTHGDMVWPRLRGTGLPKRPVWGVGTALSILEGTLGRAWTRGKHAPSWWPHQPGGVWPLGHCHCMGMSPCEASSPQEASSLCGVPAPCKASSPLGHCHPKRHHHCMRCCHPTRHCHHWDIVSLWDCHPVRHHHPKRHQSMGHRHPARHYHPVGHYHPVWHRHPWGIVTPCVYHLVLAATHSTSPVCSACLGTGIPSASSTCLGTQAFSGSLGTRSLLPAWGQDL